MHEPDIHPMFPWRSFFVLLLGALGIGFAPIFAKLAVDIGHVSPIGVGAWRMLIGAAGFAFLLVLTDRQFPAALHKSIVLHRTGLFWPGVFFAGDLLTWHTSFELTSIANSALLANFAAILVPLVGWFFYGHVLSVGLILSSITAFIGVSLLVVGNGLHETSHMSLLGDFLALITAFSYTGYMLTTKKITMKLPTNILMFWTSLISGSILLIVCLVFGLTLLPDTQLGAVYLLALGLVSQVFGQGCVAVALKKLRVGFSTITLLLAPVSSCVFSALILHQDISTWQVAGGAFVLLGVALASRTQMKIRETILK